MIKKTALVVPSSRWDVVPSFLRAWAPFPWDEVIIVADVPSADSWNIPCLFDRTVVLDWRSHERICGEHAWIISKLDAACRILGFLHAVQRGAEVVMTLDDDCMPATTPLAWFNGHIGNLYHTPAWVTSVPGLRVRGLPYNDGFTQADVMVSMGLWNNVPDLDAPHRLVRRSFGKQSYFESPPDVRVMSSKQYFPFCGMNFAFKREALPALYFPLMGFEQPYRRFDDIWGGLFAQKVLGSLGYSFTVGDPIVVHNGLSSPFKSLIGEATGIDAHERIWPLIDGAKVTAKLIPDAAAEVGKYLYTCSGMTSFDESVFIRKWGKAIGAWKELCDKALS